MSEPAVAVTALSKSYPIPFQRRSIAALRGISFQIERGEVYGLLGPNGSGKSTTLKIILGLVSATSGKATIFGRDSNLVASRESVGFLPENPYFHQHLTAAETLRFHARLCGLSGGSVDRRIGDLLELVGLTSARDRRLRGLSKGMLQRIGLAQALVHEPKLLVLDEPTAGVDPAGARDIHDLIIDLKSRGATVLLSSHLLGQVQEVCDRVGILAHGLLVQEGSLEQLLAVDEKTEVLLENANADLLRQISVLANQSGARVIGHRPSQTTLERLFLRATRSADGAESQGAAPK